MREAVRRAREYAQALGAELAAIVELADIGAENAPLPEPAASMRAAAPGYGGAAEQPPALDLEPRRQAVYAHVNARFTMTRPAL